MQHGKSVRRTVLLVVLITISGCHGRRPDFMTRVQEDCAAGDQWACNLISSLDHPPPMGKHQDTQ